MERQLKQSYLKNTGNKSLGDVKPIFWFTLLSLLTVLVIY